jgi:hypothetical protein
MITVIPESQGVKSNSDKFQRVKVSLSLVRPKKKNVFTVTRPTLFFSRPANPKLFYRQLLDPNFCERSYQFLHRIQITIFVV